MAQGVRLGSVVLFVHDLDSSVRFYADVLALAVTDRSPTAALLASASGSQLILREMGQGAAHPLGAVGIQYVTWTAASDEDLERCQHALKGRAAYRETRSGHGVRVVEGRDPNDIVVLVTYPGADQVPTGKLPVRIYGW